MGRFLKSPEQQMVQMWTPKNIGFYDNLLNRAEDNLNQSQAIKAAAIEKVAGMEFSSKEDMDAVVGVVQDMLKGATDGAFPTPSRVVSAVMEANAKVLPGVQAVKAKAKAADMYDRMRVQYGPNFWGGTDPRTQSILDQSTGKYVDPNQFKAVGIDASEVDKLLLASQQQELNYSYDEPTKSDLPGYLKINKYTGLSDAKREELYKPGSASAIAIAKSQLATMPQLREVFGSEETALTRLMERNYQTTGNYKQTIDSQYLTDRNFIDAETRARLAAANDGGTPPPLFQPVEGDVQTTDVINDLLKSFIGSGDINISSNEMEFDSKGKLLQKNIPENKAVVNPYGQVVGYTEASSERRIDAMRRNTAYNKAITSMRKSLQDSNLSIIQDPKTGKMRARTDKEVFDFYNQAVTNSANVFGKSFEINPGLGIIGANGFFQADGKRKDFRNMNIEIDRNDGKGWQPVEETSEFAEELGFDISTGKEAGEFNSVLKTLGDGVYDFMGGSSKIRTAATNKDGKEISVRYNTTPNVTSYKRPVVELYSAFTKPIPPTKDENGDIRGKEIVVGQDFDTGKPVKVEVVSDFTIDNQGRPIIQPVVLRISNDSKAGIEYTRAYMSGGYPALLAIINTNTDRALIGNKDVYTKKATNLRGVSDGE